MGRGRTFASETRELTDKRTGASIRQMTDHPAISHNLYFSNPSWTPDGKSIVFTSYRSGKPDLFKMDEAAGTITQLTDTPGFGGFAACPSRDGQRVFYNAGGQVRAVDLDTLEESVLADFGSGSAGGCSLSSDGARLMTSLHRDGTSAVVAVETDGTGFRVVREPPRAVGHVQVCPVDPDLILYSSDVNQRMWEVRIDGSAERALFVHDKSVWITHETFLGHSDEVMFVHWPYALRGIRAGEDEDRTIASFNAWHPSPRADGSLIVCDTTCPDVGLQLIDPKTGKHETLCFPGSSNGGSQWAKTVPEDDQKTRPATYGPQWSHPHPSFSPDGKRVIYTSDRTGVSQIYVVDVPVWGTSLNRVPRPGRARLQAKNA